MRKRKLLAIQIVIEALPWHQAPTADKQASRHAGNGIAFMRHSHPM